MRISISFTNLLDTHANYLNMFCTLTKTKSSITQHCDI